MSEEVNKFKEGLKYKFDGYNKILNGIEVESVKHQQHEEAIREVLQDFENIKKKIDMIAAQRIREITSSKFKNMSTSFNFKNLISRYAQFKSE